MKNYLGRIILLVGDYGEALNFYETNFGFKKRCDITTSPGQRYLHIGTDSPEAIGISIYSTERLQIYKKPIGYGKFYRIFFYKCLKLPYFYDCSVSHNTFSVNMVEKITDKRTAIMEAALKLFSEKGFKETSTANISQLAGVATGTLFLYFENKEQLINRLYLESKEEFANYTRQGLEEEKTLKAELRHIWDRWMFWTIAHPEKSGFMLYFSASPFISKMTKEASMTNMPFVNVLIKKAIAGKQLVTKSDRF